MKRWDRLFIACMVLIVCFSWIYWLKEFWKSRNFNWINVTWKAVAKVSADSVRATVNFAWYWETSKIRHDKVEDMFATFKEAISWLNVETSNSVDIYDTEGSCYRPNQWYNKPESCSQLTISLKFTWDNVKWDSMKLKAIIESISWALINWWSLGIENQNSPEMMELLDKANKDAKDRAEKTASAIWAKLWKLIVFSEDADWYQFGDYFSSIPDDLKIERMAIVHHTYAVK